MGHGSVSYATSKAIEAFTKTERKRMQLEKAEHELALSVAAVPEEDMAAYVEKTECIRREMPYTAIGLQVMRLEAKIERAIIERAIERADIDRRKRKVRA